VAGEVDGEERTPGQMCLTVPVPPLEGWVRARTAHYDASFVSADPSFAHAHLTLLAPWVAAPTDDDLARVARVLAPVRAFTVSLSGLAVFPDGLVHAVPAPDQPFRALTAALAAEFPDHPPYAGRYDATGGPSPHVTLDRLGPDVSLAWVREQVQDLLPARLVVDRVDLQWWGNDACRRVHSWRLAP
jgi:2'-5' RNA ligase